MKKLSVLFSALLFGGILVFVSCSKTGSTGPTGAQGVPGAPGPVLTGNINGFVILSDQYGSPVTTNLKSANVLLYDAHTNMRMDSVYADSTGFYNINNVQTGTYTMVTKMGGFGNCVHQNVQFTASTLQTDNKLSAIPTFTVTSVDSIKYVVKTGSVTIYGKIPTDARQRTLLVFVGNSNNVSPNPQDYVFASAQAVGENATTYTVSINFTSFADNGYMSGNTVYFAIFGASNNYTFGSFTDIPTSRTVYTAIANMPFGPPPSFTLP
jgi:hypothetical protein